MRKFVLNDETKINSYGFKTLNNGINLDRFKSNPVMLDQHENETTSVVGRWNNIRIEGSLLVADAEFDTEDKDASLLAGKVDRGFIKGASMGISFDPRDFVTDKEGNSILEKCELFEASICAIPSNANALSLYNKSGQKLDAKQVTKLLSFTQKLQNMDLLQELIKLLNLGDGATNEDVYNAVKGIVEKNTETEELKFKQTLDTAILEGRIHATNREFYLKSMRADFDGTNKILNGFPKKQSLADRVNNVGNNTESRVDWTLDDYRKKAPDELKRNPTLYNALLAKSFQQ